MSSPIVSLQLASPQLGNAQALFDRLLKEHRPGFALQREFHTDPGIYQLDLERIWRRGWLFAAREVKRPGDYVVFDVDTGEQDWDLCERNQAAGVGSSRAGGS